MSEHAMATQQNLFDTVTIADGVQVHRARRTDPPTSHRAAKRAPVRGHKARVLEALRAGPAGQTEIGRRTGLLPHQVNKRLADLHEDGKAEPTGREVENGREREWRVRG